MRRRKVEGSEGSLDSLTEANLAQHRDTIRRYLTRLLRPDELEDGTQVVLQRALENLTKFRGESSPRVWLLGIARNVGLEIARARQRDIARTWRRPSRSGAEGTEDTATVDTLPALEPDQEERLGRKEQQALALSALGDMSLDDKLALLVTYVDGLPGPEAAELLGVSFAAFRQRLSRARQTLSQRLAQAIQNGEPGSAEVMAEWQHLLNPQPPDSA